MRNIRICVKSKSTEACPVAYCSVEKEEKETEVKFKSCTFHLK